MIITLVTVVMKKNDGILIYAPLVFIGQHGSAITKDRKPQIELGINFDCIVVECSGELFVTWWIRSSRKDHEYFEFLKKLIFCKYFSSKRKRHSLQHSKSLTEEREVLVMHKRDRVCVRRRREG